MTEIEQKPTHTITPAPTTPTHDPWRRAFVILLVVSLCLGSVTIGAIGNWWFTKQSSSLTSLTSGEDGNKTITQEEQSIANVAKKVAPSVVSIVTSSKVRSMYGTASQSGAGTGIIISKDGYVLTNNHVIDGASKVSVVDSSGNIYDSVDVIGRDPLNDVAFLKIDSDSNFTPAELGDSSTIRVGQQVVAIGNALGQYQNTVTSGIISGAGRPVTASTSDGETESLTDLLQTDASINPGNSGGPLLNMSGQVIGINTAIADDANGIGFAIPINATKGVIAEVLENGKVQRAFLGVNYLDVTPEVARENNLSVSTGAYVFVESGSPVAKNSPAEKAGIQKGDVIQKINDITVGSQGGLSSIIGQFRPGDTVTVTILRDGITLTKELTFSAYKQ